MNPVDRIPSPLETAEACAAIERATHERDLREIPPSDRPPLEDDCSLLVAPACLLGMLVLLAAAALYGKVWR